MNPEEKRAKLHKWVNDAGENDLDEVLLFTEDLGTEIEVGKGLWTEIERRDLELEQGIVKGIPWEIVKEDLVARIKGSTGH